MRTYIFLPPLKNMTGGVAVLHQIAGHLHAAGYDVAVVPREDRTPVPEGVPVCPWQELALTPQDIWFVPEGWVNALMPGLQAGARNVLYVQNWSYMLSGLPEGVSWGQLDVSFLSVSQPVAWFVEHATGQKSPVLRPGIDTSVFYPACNAEDESDAGAHGSVRSRIAWMPRKNKALAQRIRETVEARCAMLSIPLPEWVEIHGKTQAEVAALLRGADIFLATGFPEGCPLPPLEALASGCILAGFSGLGGWDYMRQGLAAEYGGYTPWWPLRDVRWEANALVVADADVPAAANAVEKALIWKQQAPEKLAALRSQARTTVASYTVEKQHEAVLSLWKQAADGELFVSRSA